MTPLPLLAIKHEQTPYARVFVGNLPLPRDMPEPEQFRTWFDQEMCKLTEGQTKKEEETEDSKGLRYVRAVEAWSSTDGVCFLCFDNVEHIMIALKLNGVACKNNHLAVTLYQCLPEPNAAITPLLMEAIPSLAHLPLWRNRGYLVFAERTDRKMEEQELRSLFEALGGPLDSLFLYKDLPQLPIVGRCSFANSLIIESVITRLRRTEGNTLSVAVLIDPRRSEVLASLERSSQSFTQCSMSEQLMTDSVTAFLLRTGRMVGATPSRVVQLSNFIPLEDILCDTLRSELITAIKTEAEKYGHLENVICPWPTSRVGVLGPDAAVAKVLLEYSDTTAARRAQAEFNGKTYDGRVVTACFYPLLLFQLKQYYLFNP